jgi:tetratricopeptide (TPR) repeat protein
MSRRLYGDRHPDVASALSNLGAILSQRGDHASAEPLLREAAESGLELLGEHPEVADALQNLGTAVRELGRLDEADSLLHRSLEMNRATRGARHPRTALVLFHLATVAHTRGDCATAVPIYREALEIQEDALPAGHDEPARTRDAIERCGAASGT